MLLLLPLLLGAAETADGCSGGERGSSQYNRRVKEPLAAKSSNFGLGGACKKS